MKMVMLDRFENFAALVTPRWEFLRRKKKLLTWLHIPQHLYFVGYRIPGWGLYLRYCRNQGCLNLQTCSCCHQYIYSKSSWKTYQADFWRSLISWTSFEEYCSKSDWSHERNAKNSVVTHHSNRETNDGYNCLHLVVCVRFNKLVGSVSHSYQREIFHVAPEFRLDGRAKV